MPKKILVTSALLYANGPLHIGHLVEYIQTDIFVRFKRLIGDDVIYCCADDTHGAPIQINAEKLGMTPEQLIAKFYKEHVRDFERFGVKFDNYYTTNSDENKHYADLMFKRAMEKGFIYKKRISQLYCPKDTMFLPDRYVKGICPKCGAEDQYGDVCEKCGTTYKPVELKKPRCAICSTVPKEKESEHYFFKLSDFKESLESWLKNPKLQKEIVNSVRQWIDEGLSDWDITRDGPYFGFKIPGEENLFYYVWWDAPIGYLASLENHLRASGMTAEEYWNSAEVHHFIGKDIIYFHFLFWPAVLEATGFKHPDNITVHGFLTVDGEKMSKSRGTFLTAEEFAEKYEPEYFRFFIASMLGKKLADVDLSFDDFNAKVNNELVANIGNFCYRTLSFIDRNFNGKFNGIDEDKSLINDLNGRVAQIKDAYEKVELKKATAEILSLSALGNKYMQDKAPWKMIKEDRAAAEKVMGSCFNMAKDLCILMKPIMPEFAEKLESQLNLKDLKWDDLGINISSHKIGKPEILVQKIEAETRNVFPFDLRTAKITDVKPHPDADKLLIMQLDLGKEKRQIVAGLKPYYEAEKLKGKTIIVVTNLKAAKLRGEVSQGMLLAASHGDVVRVIEPEAAPGTQVAPDNHEIDKKELKFEQFMKLNKMQINDGKLKYEGLVLKAKNVILVDMPDGSTVR